MTDEYFHRLIALPLFQGLTREDALTMAGRARFDFRRPRHGALLAREGEECRALIFVIQGQIRMQERAADGSFTLEEYVNAPIVLQPERLFGRRNRYSKDIYAEGDDVQLLVVSKQDVRDILFSYTAFHLNYLNCVCSCQQLLLQRLWMPEPKNLRQRFIAFLRQHADQMRGHKRLIVGMNELAAHLLTTRLNVSRLLHELEDEGLIALQRGVIDIPAAQQLI
ncbi:MAG: Crp/Fnr family transcriptional regulator [Bacteroidaceae bacterium]|nr:Crp/Fnr family transcriptional regulator [Bacteroidaceae bacterium]